jgi:dipeptidyl aminopeptidase/acylaminoacyl peptidase
MIKKALLAFLLLPCAVAFSQSKKETMEPQPIGWKDVPGWRTINNFQVTLSPDGKWAVYPITAAEADGELVVKKLNDTVERRFPIGFSSFPQFSFSEDGKWLVFKESPKFKEVKANEKTPGRQLFEKLYLLDLSSNKKTEFERAGSFMLNGKTSTHLVIKIVKERSIGARPEDGQGGDLLIIELANGKAINIGNVGEFSFNKAGNLLAYTIDAANKTGNGLYLYNINSRQTTVLDNDKTSYKFLGWDAEKDAVAVLKLKKDEKYKTEKGTVLGVKNLLQSPSVFTYDPEKDSLSFPAKMTISAMRRPYWSEDLSRMFFGIAALEPVKKEEDTTGKSKPAIVKEPDSLVLVRIKADTSIKSVADLKRALEKAEAKGKPEVKPANDATKPDMTIWHWQDKRLQSRQQVQEMQDKNFSYVAMVDVTTNKFTRLNDGNTRSLSIMPKQLYAVAEDIDAYELDQNLDGQSYSDLYIINLKTGAKTKLKEKFYRPSFSSTPRPSPDGLKFTYGDDGHYYVYDLTTNTSTNITQKIATSFVNTEDDHNVTKPLTPIIGWSSDSKYVLIRDLWDIWQVAANGSSAVNLTLNGKKEQIRYTNRYSIDEEEKGFDLKKKNYFRIYGEWTKKSGIVMLDPGTNGLKPGATVLLWEDASVGSFAKAKNANVFMYSKEDFNKPAEFFTANEKLNSPVQFTKNAPDYSKYKWSAGTQLVNYVSDKGDTLQGALFLPAGYEKGKKYPTLVYYYEKLSQTLHSYSNPGFSGTGWNPALYTSNGYAVFIPDIVYKMDDPGMSAVWCVLPAVKAAIQTGVIDETKIGIHGHSWGGYQTAFLITQTNMFKAAAAGAPLTNMVSMYDLIYWNSGGGNMSIFEASQGRFRGAPWENWDSYLRNSPVYHVKKVNTPLLMLHNDKDGAVDFTQGIEYYNALRRLKKPVIMMQYKGENHGLAKMENRKDYSVRMMEFFDHHLKGKEAPDWLKNGIDRLKLPDHLENRAF